MNDITIALAILAWCVIGAMALCKAISYDDDLDALDTFFCVTIGAFFGPGSLVVLLCIWSDYRTGDT